MRGAVDAVGVYDAMPTLGTELDVLARASPELLRHIRQATQVGDPDRLYGTRAASTPPSGWLVVRPAACAAKLDASGLSRWHESRSDVTRARIVTSLPRWIWPSTVTRWRRSVTTYIVDAASR